MDIITVADAVRFIEDDTHGRFFSVKFKKRTNGEIRVMSCKYGVKKFVTGVGAAYDFKEHDLVCVIDTNIRPVSAKSYRTIAVEGLITIKIDGVEKLVLHNGKPHSAASLLEL